ncbi:hypothetical protein FIBSPDRAFT_958338 [Athelia psychrophila]|uniref:Carbamoyl phosphate synthase ATP-binding domain-containing protein n=1 Tax=Athelia psychrophila TaxID=1759441 RepID=A0A166EQ58_9AGAM|nr:hypothetical protein FIBSPDRAFT_958338 [Fibularhizoctonia sp. CBS 109695]
MGTSVRRRFQKRVETAPSTITRNLAQLLLTASTKMARAWRYQSRGTFACLVHSRSGDWVFLEINPRREWFSIAWLAGRRMHVDILLCRAGVRECNAGTDFDSLLEKIMARGRDLGEAAQQTVLAPRETSIGNGEG